MSAVTPGLVKQLREQTGAGMMDCKKALEESAGDIEGATDWLRKKGLASAAKKAGRVAAEGLIGMRLEGTVGALVEVNSETDFVARNEGFQAMVTTIAALAPAAKGDVEALKAMTIEASGRSVQDEVAHMIGVIGENMTVRRTATLAVPEGVVAGYLHNQAAPGLGKIGVLVGLSSTGDAEVLTEVGKQIAMHIAATAPQALDIAAVDPALVERERAIAADKARATGKPENIIERMVEGALRKFYEEQVLVEQAFVIEPTKRVREVVADAAKRAGASVALSGYVRLVLGEGIEKETADLAAEVAKLTQS